MPIDDDPPERRIHMAERLASLETEIKHFGSHLQRTAKEFEGAAAADRQIQQQMTDLIASVGALQNHAVESKTDIRQIKNDMVLKATTSSVEHLEERLGKLEKRVDQGATVLRTIDWTLKTFGIGTVLAIAYYLLTGDIPTR